MKTGILVHGCNLGAFQWKRISWGDAPELLGRLTRAILFVMEGIRDPAFEISVMVLGTGVRAESKHKRGHSNSTEASEMRRLMFENLDRLIEFRVFADRFPELGNADFAEQLRSTLERITELAEDCQNTVEEIENAAWIFRRHSIDRPILISSPVHLPRCIKEACVLFEKGQWPEARHHLVAAPSETCYQNTTASDVAIFEPPHRPDRPMFPIQQLVKRISRVDQSQMSDFLMDLDALLEDYDA